ncbi:MAG: hypothetical protein ACKOZU_07690 [Planctomycetaceae bacterium]
MGIIAFCPNGHRIKVKDELAGRKGICPTCAARFRIPLKTAGAEGAAVVAGGDAPVGPQTARVVSLDPLFAGSLPAAVALDEAEAVFATEAAARAADAAPDFVRVDDEAVAEDRDAFVPAAEPSTHDLPAADEPATSHALLDERPDLSWCVAARGGAPSAPLDAPAMRAWLDSGAAAVDHVVWRQDWPDWRPLQEVFPEALPPSGDGRP